MKTTEMFDYFPPPYKHLKEPAEALTLIMQRRLEFMIKNASHKISRNKQVKENIGDRIHPDVQLVTRKQASLLIGVSAGTIDRWAREGKIKRIYPFGNKVVRFSKEELLKSLQGNN